MDWNEKYTKDRPPSPEEIDTFIGIPQWGELCIFIETKHASKPVLEHSSCSMALGYNIKYKRKGRSLCTLYPKKDILIVWW